MTNVSDPLTAIISMIVLAAIVGFICYRSGAGKTREAVTNEFKNQFNAEKTRHETELRKLKAQYIEETLKRERDTKEHYHGLPIPLEDIKSRFPEDTFTVVDENIYPIRLDKKRTLFCVKSPEPLKKGMSYSIIVEKVATVTEVR